MIMGGRYTAAFFIMDFSIYVIILKIRTFSDFIGKFCFIFAVLFVKSVWL